MTTPLRRSLVDRPFASNVVLSLVAGVLSIISLSAQTTISDRTVVTTFAGEYEAGEGRVALFDFPTGIAIDAEGSTYVADSNNQIIRRITSAGIVSTIAGTLGGFGALDGRGNAAQFSGPQGLAADQFGQVYVADTNNQIIRKISPLGVVTTFAGTEGVTGARDGSGAEAQFDLPAGLAVDSGGNVYVADSGNQTIRKITPDGVVTTLAGLAGEPGCTDGPVGSARFSGPQGVAVDRLGNVYVADANNHAIRMIAANGEVSTIAGHPESFGNEDGSASQARFYYPFGIAVDRNDVLYVTDLWNSTIRRILPDGRVSTLAGSAGAIGRVDAEGAASRLSGPRALAVNGSGDLYIADTGNNLIRKATTVRAPRFIRQPEGRIGVLGEAVSLQAEVEATVPVTYSWRKDGILLPGADTTVLLLPALAANVEGFYSLDVRSEYGGIVSQPVEVRMATPQFLAQAKFDLLWSNGATGERALWLMDGTQFLFSFTLGRFPPEWSVAARGDFNGDGYLDIVWSNNVTGERALWLMRQTVFLGSSTLGLFPLEWTVAATGDFNQDAKCDLVWSNSLTGERALWLMDGMQFLQSSTLGVFPLEWTVVASGDFNADLKTDLVWSNSITGERAIWLMDGLNYVGASTLGTFPVEWTIGGAGDFNGDHKTDLIWLNVLSGERAIWFMDNTHYVGVASLGTFPRVWSVTN